MKKLFVILLLLIAPTAGAGIVNNSNATAADSLVIDFHLWDSSAFQMVQIAAGDSVWFTVYYPSGAIAFGDTVLGNSSMITSAQHLSQFEYSIKKNVSAIDGSGKDGVYRWKLIVWDISLDLPTPFSDDFQLYQTDDYNVWADNLTDSLTLVYDTLVKALDSINDILDNLQAGVDVGSIQSDVITAGSIAPNAIGSSEIASDAIGSPELGGSAAREIADSTLNDSLSSQAKLTALPDTTNTNAIQDAVDAILPLIGDSVWNSLVADYNGVPLSFGDSLTKTLTTVLANLFNPAVDPVTPQDTNFSGDTLARQKDSTEFQANVSALALEASLFDPLVSPVTPQDTNLSGDTLARQKDSTDFQADVSLLALESSLFDPLVDPVTPQDTNVVGDSLARLKDSIPFRADVSALALESSLFDPATDSVIVDVSAAQAGLIIKTVDSIWQSLLTARNGVAGSFGDSANGWGQTAASGGVSDAEMAAIADSVWKKAFATLFLAGSMGDSLSTATYVQGAAGSVDSTLISNLIHRIVWGTPRGSGADSSTQAERDIGVADSLYNMRLSAALELWNVLFTTGFTAGSMGDSLSDSSYVRMDPSALPDTTNTNAIQDVVDALHDTLAYPGPRGPGIYLDSAAGNTNTVIGTDGTAKNPVSTIAAAKTLALALGYKRYYFLDQSTFLDPANDLPSDHTNWDFVGIGHQVSLAFGSQLVTGARFEALTLSGAMHPSGSDVAFFRCILGPITANYIGHADNCWLVDTLVMKNARDINFSHCQSDVSGNNTPTIDLSAGSSTMSMRSYSGGIRIMNGTSTDTVSVETDGQVIISANNTSLNITLRGMLTPTDSGVTTNKTIDAVFSRRDAGLWIWSNIDTAITVDTSDIGQWLRVAALLGIKAEVWDTLSDSAGNVLIALRDTVAKEVSLFDPLVDPVTPHDTTTGGDTLALKKDSLVYQGGASGLTAAAIASEVNDTLSAGHGFASWEGVGGGTGPNELKVFAIDTANGDTLSGISIFISNLTGAPEASDITRSDGAATVKLTADIWIVEAATNTTKWSFDDTTVVVSLPFDTFAILGYPVVIAEPADPTLSNVHATVKDVVNRGFAGIDVIIQLETTINVTATTPGITIAGVDTVQTDSLGFFEFPTVIRSTTMDDSLKSLYNIRGVFLKRFPVFTVDSLFISTGSVDLTDIIEAQ